jgi:hypothetical protein
MLPKVACLRILATAGQTDLSRFEQVEVGDQQLMDHPSVGDHQYASVGPVSKAVDGAELQCPLTKLQDGLLSGKMELLMVAEQQT